MTIGLRFPKPESRRRTKGRKKRHEATVARSVRAIVADRDGRCRLFGTTIFGCCAGRSEWAHMDNGRRFKTRGMRNPHDRHRTDASLILCGSHHQHGPFALDRHTLLIELLTDRGADGPLRFLSARGTLSWQEEKA